jgi:hypothetical protein
MRMLLELAQYPQGDRVFPMTITQTEYFQISLPPLIALPASS